MSVGSLPNAIRRQVVNNCLPPQEIFASLIPYFSINACYYGDVAKETILSFLLNLFINQIFLYFMTGLYLFALSAEYIEQIHIPYVLMDMFYMKLNFIQIFRSIQISITYLLLYPKITKFCYCCCKVT